MSNVIVTEVPTPAEILAFAKEFGFDLKIIRNDYGHDSLRYAVIESTTNCKVTRERKSRKQAILAFYTMMERFGGRTEFAEVIKRGIRLYNQMRALDAIKEDDDA